MIEWFEDLPEWADRLIHVVIVVLVALLIIRAIRGLIDRIMSNRQGASRRADTLTTLMKSVVTYAVGILAVLQVLQSGFGVNVTSLLAAAGVLGVAVGFGAQSLVKDIISGFFILFEDQFAVGDSVTIGDFTGTVQSLGLRSACLKSFAGDRFYLPNGEITKVINHSREERAVVVKCNIAYEADLTRALEVMAQAGADAMQQLDYLIELPEVIGVGALEKSGVNIHMVCKCNPGDQAKLEREMLARVKHAFDQAGIEIPYERLVLAEPKSRPEV